MKSRKDGIYFKKSIRNIGDGDIRDKDDDEFELDSVVGRSSYLILAVDSPQALFVGSYPINIMVILMMMVIMTIFMMVMILILLAFLMELIIMLTREGAQSPTLFFSRNAIEWIGMVGPANKFIAIPITTTISKYSTESTYILLVGRMVRISKSNNDNCQQLMSFSLKTK